MIVVCATDACFADLAGPLLRSIAVNGGIPEAEIVVLSDGLDKLTQDWLRQSADGLCVRFVEVDHHTRTKVGTFRTSRHETPATFFRLLIADLLPEVTGRVLYLDVDVIVNGSLRPLFEMPLEGHCIAAVQNAGDPDWHAALNRKFGREPGAPNINAGVLVMDLARWRDLSVSDRCFDVLSWAPDVEFADQDAINAILGDDVKLLDRTWNLWSIQSKLLTYEDYAAARIVHFTSWRKPNLVECQHPARGLYLEHRAHTPWAQMPLMTRQPAGLRRFIVQLLLRFHERHPKLRPATGRDARRRLSDTRPQSG